MAALTLSRIPLQALHRSMEAICRGPLRALAGRQASSQEVLSECCIKVFAIFAGIQANACRVFSSHSTSRDKNVRDYVVVLKKEFGALKRQVETALAAHKTLIRTPFGSKVWDIVRTVERRSEIYVSYPPEELDDRSIFEILTLEHEEDFVFNGVTYPTVLAAFKALLKPQTAITPMSYDEMMNEYWQNLKREEILVRHNEALEREEMMESILRAKFASRSHQICLIATCDVHLWLAMPSEFRHPMDTEDTGNRLGDILMKVRAVYRWKPIT